MISNFWVLTTLIITLVCFLIPIVIGLISELVYFLKSRSYYNFGDGFDDLSYNTAYMIMTAISVGIGCISLVSFIIILFSVIDFEKHEDVYYKTYEQERAAIQNILENEDSIVREKVMESVIDYNKEIIEIKSSYNSGKYTFSFSGDYDWNKIENIVLE